MINELTPEWWTDYAMAMLFFCLIFANGSAFVLMLRINSGGKPAAEQPELTLRGIQHWWHSLKTELILYPFTKQQGGVLAALSLTGLYSVSINPNGSPHSLRSCSRHTAEPLAFIARFREQEITWQIFTRFVENDSYANN